MSPANTMFGSIQKRLSSLTQQLKKKAIILCYHRIAGKTVDPWNSVVSPECFDEQLNVLSRHFNVVSVSDLVNDFDNVCTRKTVCLSFDDGYLDNFSVALPLLKKYQVPASFFIASAFIGSNCLFWWDELTDIILRSPVLPTKLFLNINQKQFIFELDESAILNEADHRKLAGWKYYQKPPNKRCILYLHLWKFLRTLIPSEQQAVMCELKKWSGCYQASDYAEKLPMSELQLQELESDPLFTVGLHTYNHVAMGLHSPVLQEKEIVENRSHLTKILKKDTDMIAFPHGSYNNDSIQLVKKLGLRACLTSKKFIVTKASDNYELGRYSVREWEGTILKNRLDSWFWKAEM